MGDDFVVKFKCWKENKIVDALSRREDWAKGADQAQLIAITLPVATWLEELKSSYHGDAEIQAIFKVLKINLRVKLRMN